MSNQADSEQVGKKAKRPGLIVVAQVSLKTLGCGGALVLVVCAFGLSWFASEWASQRAIGWTIGVMVLILFIVGYAIYAGFLVASAANSRAEDIETDFHVRNQVHYLSAGQFLLRGSDEPSATPDELLRAAHGKTIEPAEELLRSAEGQQLDMQSKGSLKSN